MRLHILFIMSLRSDCLCCGLNSIGVTEDTKVIVHEKWLSILWIKFCWRDRRGQSEVIVHVMDQVLLAWQKRTVRSDCPCYRSSCVGMTEASQKWLTMLWIKFCLIKHFNNDLSYTFLFTFTWKVMYFLNAEKIYILKVFLEHLEKQKIKLKHPIKTK